MKPTRRRVLGGLAATVATPAWARRPSRRPRMPPPLAIAVGDVDADHAVVWAATARPCKVWVEYGMDPGFRSARRLFVAGPGMEATTNRKVRINKLNGGQTIHYRVWTEDSGAHSPSVALLGRFRVPPASRGDVRLCWSGDTAGQGWGIDPARGGMRTYAAIQAVEPDVFIHCGDLVYADGPIPASVPLPDGTTWTNVTNPQVAKVAETLDEFRARYAYNFQDEHVVALHRSTSVIQLWDDHEVRNNWYPGQILDDERYTEKQADVLAARAMQAFWEWTPTWAPDWRQDPFRLHRSFRWGDGVEIFRLDQRRFRGPNAAAAGDGPTPWLGEAQLAWLLDALEKSTSTWKIIASDMPLGLVVRDGAAIEAAADGLHGGPRGREHELARLLSGMKAAGVRNVVWLTADVHYTAAHHYRPERAAFQDFDAFWEFVSGPLHAGTFGPAELDGTFGPEVVFSKHPPAGRANLSPAEGYQFFGQIDFAAATGALTVRLKDVVGETLHTEVLTPV